jgi:hypothetical protein
MKFHTGKPPEGWESIPGFPGFIREIAPPEPPKDGEQGPAGPQGEPGPIGPQGPQGEPGIQGPKGDTGPQGPAGKDGKDGLPGKDGAQGKDGKPGKPGKDGKDAIGLEDVKVHGQDMLFKLTDGKEKHIRIPTSQSFGGGGTSGTSGGVSSITSNDGSINVSGSTNVTLSVNTTNLNAQHLVCEVRNATGSTLLKGTPVYINGAIGQLPTVTMAKADSDAHSAQTLGVMTADLANNSNGYVTIIGFVEDLDTSAYTDGQQLYLSTTTYGEFQTTKPKAPGHLVYIAVVEYAHRIHGKLFVKVQNGYELDEIHDVQLNSPTNNQLISYESSSGLWKNTSSPTVNQLTASKLDVYGLSYLDLKFSATFTSGTTGTLTGENDSYYFDIVAYDSYGNHTDLYVDTYYWKSYYTGEFDTNITITFNWNLLPGAAYYRVYITDDFGLPVSYVQTTSNTIILSSASQLTADSSFPTTHTAKSKIRGPLSVDGQLTVNNGRISADSNILSESNIGTVFRNIDTGNISAASLYINSSGQGALNASVYDAALDGWYSTPFAFDGGIKLTGERRISFNYYDLYFPLYAPGAPGYSLVSENAAGVTKWGWVAANCIYFRKEASTTLANSASFQSIFGLNTGTLLDSAMANLWEIECEFRLDTTGTTSHTESFGLNSSNSVSITIANKSWIINRTTISTTGSTVITAHGSGGGLTTVTGAITTTQAVVYRIKGHFDFTNTYGYTTPGIQFSAAPGGTSTIAAGAWVKMWPLGNRNANSNPNGQSWY